MPETKLKAGITAVGKYLPSKRLTNKDLEQKAQAILKANTKRSITLLDPLVEALRDLKNYSPPFIRLPSAIRCILGTFYPLQLVTFLQRLHSTLRTRNDGLINAGGGEMATTH